MQLDALLARPGADDPDLLDSWSAFSIRPLTRRKCSEQVLNSWAVWTCSRSPNTNIPMSCRASMMAPFPFCRGTTPATSNAAHFPSYPVRSESNRKDSCQSSRIRSAQARTCRISS
jgi:hypothetical protein